MVLRNYSVRIKGNKNWEVVKANSKIEAAYKFLELKEKVRRKKWL